VRKKEKINTKAMRSKESTKKGRRFPKIVKDKRLNSWKMPSCNIFVSVALIYGARALVPCRSI